MVKRFAFLAMLATGVSQAQSVTPESADTVQLLVSPGLRLPAGIIEDDQPVFLDGDQVDGTGQDTVTLTGNGSIRRTGTSLKGDRIDYDQRSGWVDAVGNVRLMRDGGLISGPGLRYNVNTEQGEVDQPRFHIGASGAAGHAATATIHDRQRMSMTDVVYSGCPCPDPAWEIRARDVDLDFEENEGIARWGVLYFKDVPILASPYLTFPIKKERKSGLLMPTYGASSKGGLEFALPYYFNLAPNYDMTLTPRVLSKRGVQLGGEFRYMGQTYEGQMAGTWLNRDREAGRDRWMYSVQHAQRLGNGFRFGWDVNGASDDDYFRDFSTFGLNESSVTNLSRRAQLDWTGRSWSSYVLVSKYQTLQDPDSPIAPPYEKWPEFGLRGATYDWNGFDIETDMRATWFKNSTYDISGVPRLNGPEGTRLSSYSTIAYPIVRAGWHITPKAGLHASHYSTDWFDTDWYRLGSVQDYRSSQTRVLPILSLDSGMTFERRASLFGKAATQTLEPRIYYLWVPYRNQADIPLYDTSAATFSFAQAFDENIYSGGWDRIANANQVTLGLTSRWLDEDTGFERLRLEGAQRVYFSDQKVTLPRETPRTGARSDYLLGAYAALTNTLTTQMSLQYNPADNEWERVVAGAKWAPQRAASISASYRYQREPNPLVVDLSRPSRPQEQVSTSVQWPLSNRWYTLGRMDYSLRENRFTQAIGGVEYKGDCCWVGRFVVQRYAVSANDANTAFFFQLELSGLGSLGTDPMSLLSKSITGYQVINPPAPDRSIFERYE
ncbi:LPS-assembly protein LptD [Alcaligenaceae bacterium SJ-26]|nr:LPS-assembly protein LptD [Alcaligenaceae bacterium SJ-26]